jgi:hypothetical protein
MTSERVSPQSLTATHMQTMRTGNYDKICGACDESEVFLIDMYSYVL